MRTRNRYRNIECISINWGGWINTKEEEEEKGMLNEDIIIKSKNIRFLDMNEIEGKELDMIFDNSILMKNSKSNIIIDNDLESMIEISNNIDNRLFDELRFVKNKRNIVNRNDDDDNIKVNKFNLSISDNETKDIIIDTFKRVMSIDMNDMIELDSPLQEMGVDSLIAIEYSNELSRILNINLPQTLVYDYPSLDKIIEYITSSYNRDREIEDNMNEIEHSNKDTVILGYSFKVGDKNNYKEYFEIID